MATVHIRINANKIIPSDARNYRLSKKSRKVWAFSSFCGIINMVMKDDGKRL